MSDEEVIKILSDYRKPDKFNKFTVIPGSLEIKISTFSELPPSEWYYFIYDKNVDFENIIVFYWAVFSQNLNLFNLSQNASKFTRFITADCLTTSLVPLKPFPLPPTNEPTFEILEFESLSEKEVHPYTTFLNHLYVYPLSLNFDTQKVFTRARNIACVVELRDSDNDEAKGIPVSHH